MMTALKKKLDDYVKNNSLYILKGLARSSPSLFLDLYYPVKVPAAAVPLKFLAPTVATPTPDAEIRAVY